MSGSHSVLKDDDAHNLAEWIGEKNIDTDGATTQEFDQFLAERAAANETPRKDKWRKPPHYWWYVMCIDIDKESLTWLTFFHSKISKDF